MIAYNRLSKSAKRNRMSDALYSGANELREFISKTAKQYGVPENEFGFWLLQAESSIAFDDGNFEIKDLQ
jgi:hypothetical protein